jgi:hypothetical protein
MSRIGHVDPCQQVDWLGQPAPMSFALARAVLRRPEILRLRFDQKLAQIAPILELLEAVVLSADFDNSSGGYSSWWPRPTAKAMRPVVRRT